VGAGGGALGHVGLLLGLRVLRLVAAHAPLPVGESGGSKEQGRMAGRGITRPAQAKRGRLGKPCQEAKLYPCATRGAVPLSGIGVSVVHLRLPMFTDPYKFTQIVKQKAKPTDSARTLVVGLHLRWCALECAHRRWRRCLSLWRPRIMVLVLSQLLIMDKSPLPQSFDGWLIGREALEFEASIKIAPALAEHGERLVLEDSPNKVRREIRFPFVAEGSGNVCRHRLR